MGGDVFRQELAHPVIIQAHNLHLVQAQRLAVIQAAAGEEHLVAGPLAHEAPPRLYPRAIVAVIVEGHLIEGVTEEQDFSTAEVVTHHAATYLLLPAFGHESLR